MRVACQVQQFDLSAHADHNELLKFIRACDPEHVVLMHSDNRQALAKDLKDEVQGASADAWRGVRTLIRQLFPLEVQ